MPGIYRIIPQSDFIVHNIKHGEQFMELICTCDFKIIHKYSGLGLKWLIEIWYETRLQSPSWLRSLTTGRLTAKCVLRWRWNSGQHLLISRRQVLRLLKKKENLGTSLHYFICFPRPSPRMIVSERGLRHRHPTNYYLNWSLVSKTKCSWLVGPWYLIWNW
jgi:hypothetical protein